MNQQIHYTPTTPKYNFPQPTMDTTLPHRLTQLSFHSLAQAIKQPYPPNQQYTDTHALQLKPPPIRLTPKHEETTVAAVDTSSMKIGETEAGILIAIRAATVWKQDRNYRYMRLGPFIYHVTEENKREVTNALHSTHLGTHPENSYYASPNLLQMPMRIAATLEKWLQTTLTKTMTNSLILFDGSLTAGTQDTPTHALKETLEIARKKHNTVMAFSKITTLRTNGHLITDALPPYKTPYLLETTGLRPKPPVLLLGDVYVAKLTKGNCAFRLDIDKEVSSEQRIGAAERLLANDVLSQSYPETLRLAHILCTFTANEVIAMQHYTARKCGIALVNRPDMHRLLFGPFGKGETSQ